MSTDKWSTNAEGRNDVIKCQIDTTPAVKCSRCVCVWPGKPMMAIFKILVLV